MIDKALIYLDNRINDFFKEKYQSTEPLVVLTRIADANGNVLVEGDNKIVFSLVNIEKETGVYPPRIWEKGAGGKEGLVSLPPITLSLMILFAANNDDFKEGLKLLSTVVEFFQINRVFDSENSEDLPEGFTKLTFEMVSLNFQELSHMWGCIGTKYMPSVIYKLRLLAIQGDEGKEVPKVLHPSPTINPKGTK